MAGVVSRPRWPLKLEAVGWSNAEFWVRRQAHYDLAQARKAVGSEDQGRRSHP